MLGLKYGTVQVVPYDRRWAQAFLDERARLAAVLSAVACEIEHIGSTAVPGLAAKPILDIAVGRSRGTAATQIVSAIERLGYEYRGDAGADGGHILVRESAPLVRTHHVHVVELDGDQWTSYILLRDLLRSDAAARLAYAMKKAMLARRHPSDRRSYTAAKEVVVRDLLLEATAHQAVAPDEQ